MKKALNQTGNERIIRQDRAVFKTVLATAVLLLFFFAQGAVVIVNNVEGEASAVIRGTIIALASVAAIVFSLIKHKSLTPLGFRKPEKGSSKNLLYYIPLLVIALSALVCGIDIGKGSVYLISNLFLALTVGLAEEIYFRGIICNMWLRQSKKKAVVISSVLFGLCHLMNIMGGAGIAETALQICFAFAYGIAFALIFARSRSIWPCVLLHAFHDLCSFVSPDGSLRLNVFIGAFQFVLLVAYIILIIRKDK